MTPKIFGLEHILFLLIATAISITGLIFAKKYAKSEKSQKIIIKSIAGVLLVAILTNRISIVFKYDTPEWSKILPDSFCGMSSLVLSLAVLIGKKDNPVLHFVWFIAILGGTITMFYPDFIGQNPSFFYIPTISGMLHHFISIVLVITLFLFNQITITYKKWHYSLFGFLCYLTFGAFLISVFNYDDAFHIMKPLLSDTPLTVWVVAPIYAVIYGSILLGVEMYRRKKTQK